MSVFEVAIGYARGGDRFRVQVVDSPVGHASADVDLDVVALLAGRERFERTLLLSGVATRRNPTDEERLIQGTGRELFAALLGAGEVAGRYRATAAVAAERGEDLRIVLRIDAPELAALPWEAMYDADIGGYVCRQHQLVRHIPVASAPLRLTVQPPLRILGVVSAPGGLPPLDVERERRQLTRALAEPIKNGLVELTWAPEATWAGIHEQLMAGEWHVLHFVGHGGFDAEWDEGLLSLTGEDGQPDDVEASRFADLLRQARPMPRLVVLNSCQGAATSTGDLFSGTAAALARSGVAAVAAMQYSVSDAAAIAFARGFYTALARARGVDDALSAGRIAILGTSGQTLEWLTPVLYLRGSESRLFEVAPRVRKAEAPAAPAPAPDRRRPAREDFRLLHTLAGHRKQVVSTAFSADHALLATGSEDWTVRVWDVATGACRQVLTSDLGPPRQLRFSPRGNLLAGMISGTVQLWDLAAGESAQVLAQGARAYEWFSFSRDGTLLLTLADPRTLRLWNIATGQVARSFGSYRPRFAMHRDRAWITHVALSPGNAFLVTTLSRDTTARVWNVATGQTVGTLKGDKYYVSALQLSPDGSLLAMTSHGTIRLWDIATGELKHVLTGTGHTAVTAGTFSPDGSLFALASADTNIRLWDTASGKPRHILAGHDQAATGAHFARGGALLVTAATDTALAWDVSTGACVREMTGRKELMETAVVHHDGSLLAAWMDGKTAQVWTLGVSRAE
jgi:WD40 repeat protein